MKSFSESLLSELEHQLHAIQLEIEDNVKYYEYAINAVITILEKLKTQVIKYKFQNKVEEIDFFRNIKPQFAGKVIYYNQIYNIESGRPLGSKKAIRKYYTAELTKLKVWCSENQEFYKYYRTGNRCLDNKYFIRGKYDVKLTLDSFYYQADQRFSTSHDYKVARILANEQITTFLEKEISKLEQPENKQPINNIQSSKTHKWTASKVALTELIYALHAEGVFNDGNADLKEITAIFESAFHINLGQYHRTFLEIRERKSERTKFLNNLREKLIIRMNIADELT